MLQKLTILYAEDDEDDVYLFERALRRARVDADLRVVPNGESAIEYLEGTGGYADRSTNPFPNLIFVGWRIPLLVDGAKFLEWCRKSPVCASVTVVVLSGAGVQADLDQARRLGADYALAKPADLLELADMLARICNSIGARPPPAN